MEALMNVYLKKLKIQVTVPIINKNHINFLLLFSLLKNNNKKIKANIPLLNELRILPE